MKYNNGFCVFESHCLIILFKVKTNVENHTNVSTQWDPEAGVNRTDMVSKGRGSKDAPRHGVVKFKDGRHWGSCTDIKQKGGGAPVLQSGKKEGKCDALTLVVADVFPKHHFLRPPRDDSVIDFDLLPASSSSPCTAVFLRALVLSLHSAEALCTLDPAEQSLQTISTFLSNIKVLDRILRGHCSIPNEVQHLRSSFSSWLQK